MFVAAMIASAFAYDNAEMIINAGLSEIPENSRLADAVRKTLQWCKNEKNWLFRQTAIQQSNFCYLRDNFLSSCQPHLFDFELNNLNYNG